MNLSCSICPGRATPALIGSLSFLLCWTSNLAPAQTPDAPPASKAPNPIEQLPLVPTKSPIDFFRQLLSMSPQEQEEALTSKTPEQRAVLQSKIREYGQMPEMVRELRLHLLQLRVYLLPLMKISPSEREKWIPYIPEKDRQPILARLQDWDKLSSSQQQIILQDPSKLHYFLYRQHSDPAFRRAALAAITPVHQQPNPQLEQAIARWRAFSEARRSRLSDFFSSDPGEQRNLLQVLPEQDRLQMERVIQGLARLSPTQREQWFNGLNKFASLTPEERGRFILQTKHWQTMSRSERDLWRQITSRRKEPPLPPSRSRPLRPAP